MKICFLPLLLFTLFSPDTEKPLYKDASAQPKVEMGKEIDVELIIRDVQATLIDGVELVIEGKVLAQTDKDGKCKSKIPSGVDRS